MRVKPIMDFIDKVICGDCIEVMKTMPDNSVDAIVTDPPYGLGFMNKEWDKPEEHRRLVEREMIRSEQRFKEGKSPTTAPFSHCIRPGLPIKGAKEGKWFQDWCELWAKECFRILKPGGYLLSFFATRTYHRGTTAIEDAGFEIRDCVMWVYGSGFPKSLNIGKAVDKLQGNEREYVETKKKLHISTDNTNEGWKRPSHYNDDGTTKTEMVVTKGNSEWEGWGTALKPACEPIVVARKPLSEKSVAENVLKWGTGGINIDRCRIPINSEDMKSAYRKPLEKEREGFNRSPKPEYNPTTGRFPANFIHDGSAEVVGMFPDNKGAFAPVKSGHSGKSRGIYGDYAQRGDDGATFYNDGLQSAARFFYTAKASKDERNEGCEGLEEKEENLQGLDTRGRTLVREDGTKTLVERWKGTPSANIHPTVKPISLMRYLCKLVTPKGGLVLDPFAGSGSTLIAARLECFNFIGIEKEAEYVRIANARLSHIPLRLDMVKP